MFKVFRIGLDATIHCDYIIETDPNYFIKIEKTY